MGLSARLFVLLTVGKSSSDLYLVFSRLHCLLSFISLTISKLSGPFSVELSTVAIEERCLLQERLITANSLPVTGSVL